tara:strand:- start:190 stop:756 length:567 start_codon:yes stop_codon:yes gene_type:complete
MYDISNNTEVICNDYINVDPSLVTITPESYNIHKISMDYLQENGRNIIPALKEFNKILNKCDVVVGHNIQFDKKMVLVECFRNKVLQYFTRFYHNRKVCKPEYCTMINTSKFCNILKLNKTGKEYIKYPKLQELYSKLFTDAIIPETLHDSLIDILITLRCYIKYIYNLDIIEINNNINNLFLKYNLI